jgi:hypothetical protein
MPNHLDKRTFEIWDMDLANHVPAPPPEDGGQAYPKVVSFIAAPLSAGVVLRMTLGDGSETECLLNAVVAQAIARTIDAAGRQVGWMDGDGDLVIAPTSP